MSDLDKELKAERKFKPTKSQETLKAKFYRRLEELEAHFDKDTVLGNPKLIAHVAETDRINDLLKNPEFSKWFLEAELVSDRIAGLKERSIDVLEDIIEDDDAQNGDKLKAARTLMELNDMFPGRKQEVRFLDPELDALSEAETDKKIAKLAAVLEKTNEGETNK